jgi:zinc and cadmium transporter
VATLTWIIVSGAAMSAVALVGCVTLLFPERTFRVLVLPMVALAAGTLLGGALFHMLPESVDEIGHRLGLYTSLACGIVSFFVLEQYLQWHHCHEPVASHRPLGVLILVADGLHNLMGGLAVGSAFVVDTHLGIVTWLVAAAHEVPQELGDFGILVHSGWDRRRALTFNVLSALTFLVGSLTAYALADRISVVFLVPFAAGNFVYIALADLLPELTTTRELDDKLVHTAGVAVGLGMLFVAAVAR